MSTNVNNDIFNNQSLQLIHKDLYLFPRFVMGTKLCHSEYKLLYFISSVMMQCNGVQSLLKISYYRLGGSSFGKHIYTIKMYFLIGPWIIMNLPPESLTALYVIVLSY